MVHCLPGDIPLSSTCERCLLRSSPLCEGKLARASFGMLHALINPLNVVQLADFDEYRRRGMANSAIPTPTLWRIFTTVLLYSWLIGTTTKGVIW